MHSDEGLLDFGAPSYQQMLADLRSGIARVESPVTDASVPYREFRLTLEQSDAGAAPKARKVGTRFRVGEFEADTPRHRQALYLAQLRMALDAVYDHELAKAVRGCDGIEPEVEALLAISRLAEQERCSRAQVEIG